MVRVRVWVRALLVHLLDFRWVRLSKVTIARSAYLRVFTIYLFYRS